MVPLFWKAGSLSSLLQVLICNAAYVNLWCNSAVPLIHCKAYQCSGASLQTSKPQWVPAAENPPVMYSRIPTDKFKRSTVTLHTDLPLLLWHCHSWVYNHTVLAVQEQCMRISRHSHLWSLSPSFNTFSKSMKERDNFWFENWQSHRFLV
jgi:hypothetical protein